MSEYIVAAGYLIFSLSGLFIIVKLKHLFSGRKLNSITFFIFLLVTSFFGIIHFSILEKGVSVLFTFVNQWIEGNTIVRSIATVFLFVHAFISPSSSESKRHK